MICSLNDLFKTEHKDPLNQIITKDIILQQHYMDIDTRQIKLQDHKENAQKREDALEEKWNKFSTLINEQKKQITNNTQS